jgi:histidinol dehydrogenase
MVIDRVDKIIFWGNTQEGATSGAVVSAPYAVDTNKIYKLSNLTGISALAYDNAD